MAALQQGSMAAAEQFSGPELDLRGALRSPSHHPLLTHSALALSAAAAMQPRRFYQEVKVRTGDHGKWSVGSTAVFLWVLCLGMDRCWRVEDISRL